MKMIKKNLTNQTKFRLNEISKIQNYSNSEIKQIELCSKKLSKYAAFDSIDKILFVLSAASGGACIISSVSVLGAPIGIAGTSFTPIFL